MKKVLYMPLLVITVAMIVVMFPRQEQTEEQYGYVITDTVQALSPTPFPSK